MMIQHQPPGVDGRGEPPHDIHCRCNECWEWLHSHHEPDHDGGYGGHFDDLCPLCLGDELPDDPILIQHETCYECSNFDGIGVLRELTGRTKVVNQRQDPTSAYEMTCGHWGI